MALLFTTADSDRLHYTYSDDFTTTGITISFWVYVTDNTPTANTTFINNSDSSNNGQLNFQLQDTSGQTQLVVNYSTDIINRVSTEKPAEATWTHVLANWNLSPGGGTVYYNGTIISWDVTDIDGVGTRPSWGEQHTIGGLRPSSGGNFFGGRIAEFGIWNVTLGSSEIAALAAGYSPLLIRAGRLQRYYPMDTLGAIDRVGSATIAINGSPAKSDHPLIIQPTAQILQFPPLGGDEVGLTLDADGTLDTTNFAHDAGTGLPWFSHANDNPNGASADYFELDSGLADGTYVQWFSLSDVAADFDSMTSLDLKVDVGVSGSVANDTVTVTARIYDADNDTTNALTAETASFADETDTTRVQRTVSFASLTGSKTQWNAAHIRISFVYNRVTGGDSWTMRFYGCSFNGIYAAAAPAGGRVMSSLTQHGGLAGMGGIAGYGGGLAG